MRRGTAAYVVAVALLLVAQSGFWKAFAQPSEPPARSPAEIAAERDSLAKAVRAEIAGKEDLPADSVFRNIRLLKGVPAGRIPAIMNMGFGRSLGVSCDHCHKVGDWADESNPKKQLAREMFAMVQAINNDHIWKMDALSDEKSERERPAVNCTTCHRGEAKPSQELVKR